MQIVTIARKEFHTLFKSYTVFCGYFALGCVCAYMCWCSDDNFFIIGQASLSPLFDVLNMALMLILPALTMQSIADEKKRGTLELLLTKPLTTGDIIWGKFLSQALLMFYMILTTIPYAITLACLGNLEISMAVLGYLGVVLTGLCYISIGIFASAVASSVESALFVACAICACFQYLFPSINDSWSGAWPEWFAYLSFEHYFFPLKRGVLSFPSLCFYAMVILLFMDFAKISIERYKVAK